jgi:hypothetical protein
MTRKPKGNLTARAPSIESNTLKHEALDQQHAFQSHWYCVLNQLKALDPTGWEAWYDQQPEQICGEMLPKMEKQILLLEGKIVLESTRSIKNAEPPTFERPYPPAQLRTRLQDLAQKYEEKSLSLPQNIKQIVAINLGECFSPALDFEYRRRVFTWWIFGVVHLNDLSPAQLITLRSWLNPTHDSGGAWHCDEMAGKEARAAYTEAESAKGQLELQL